MWIFEQHAKALLALSGQPKYKFCIHFSREETTTLRLINKLSSSGGDFFVYTRSAGISRIANIWRCCRNRARCAIRRELRSTPF
jgi:hypothetical protein